MRIYPSHPNPQVLDGQEHHTGMYIHPRNNVGAGPVHVFVICICILYLGGGGEGGGVCQLIYKVD